MNFLSLLFSFSGRINRVQYWLGGIGAGVAIVLIVTVLMVAGGPIDPSLTEEQRVAKFFGAFALSLMPALLVGSWIGYALAWKRFHDRGKSGVWVFLPMLPSFMMVSSMFGAIASGSNALAIAGAAQPWSTILWIIQLWFLVELGFMPGKEGTNKYGDPPGGGLSGKAPSMPRAPSGPAKRTESTPGMKTALAGAESAIDRAIAAQARAQAAAAVSAQPGAARPATAGSFGRKAAH
ncbi:MAG: DUF805 domain-containing protein [Hyphomonadaceae bacterium]